MAALNVGSRLKSSAKRVFAFGDKEMGWIQIPYNILVLNEIHSNRFRESSLADRAGIAPHLHEENVL
jgi:hypothetical protein